MSVTMLPSGGFNSGIKGSQPTNTENIYDPKTEKEMAEAGQQGDYLLAARNGYYSAQQVLEALNNGTIDPYTAALYLTGGKNGYMAMSEEQEKLYNNLLARYQSQNALIWQAEQMQKLGLSASGVLSTGAAHTSQDMSNISTNKANRAGTIANSLISMAGRMGAAGIHGASLNMVKGVASTAATSLAHTASRSLHNTMSRKEEEELMAFFANR